MTLREEILQDSGVLTEGKLSDKFALLKAPRDIFELVGTLGLYTIYRDLSKDMNIFVHDWNRLDELVNSYEPSKGKEVRELVHKIFDNIKNGKKNSVDEKYAYKYASTDRGKEFINKYHNKAEDKILDFFHKIDMIRDRIISNLDKYDARYNEYRG